MTSTLNQLQSQFLDKISRTNFIINDVNQTITEQQDIKDDCLLQIQNQKQKNNQYIDTLLLQEQKDNILSVQKLEASQDEAERQLTNTVDIVNQNFNNKTDYIHYLELQLQKHFRTESELRMQLALKNKSVQALVNDSITQYEEKIDTLVIDNELLKKQVQHLSDQVKHLSTYNQTLVKEKQELGFSLKTAEHHIITSSQVVQDQSQYFNQSIVQQKDATEKEFGMFSKIYVELKEEKQGLEKSLSSKDQMIDVLSSQFKNMKEQNSAYKQYNKHLEREFEEIKSSQVLANQEIEILKSGSGNEMISKINALEATIAELQISTSQCQ
ncbi:hypothetical protein SS50377_24641 [Spironucleus salmonicida]|uniref:Uncharacterized protein n=1 Tax=Spironucleus salmonicida TaxID=348837 RepID=V6LIS8_9EUKA|nr:hypothetical protein SS50377_24641 [Spironucleus salmonicida]|eukprot:EST44510.1 Hypothetical protein SS50377_15507 [Spironucleus salmonicida]